MVEWVGEMGSELTSAVMSYVFYILYRKVFQNYTYFRKNWTFSPKAFHDSP